MSWKGCKQHDLGLPTYPCTCALPVLATYVIRFRAPRADMSNAEMDVALAAADDLMIREMQRIVNRSYGHSLRDFTAEIEPA